MRPTAVSTGAHSSRPYKTLSGHSQQGCTSSCLDPASLGRAVSRQVEFWARGLDKGQLPEDMEVNCIYKLLCGRGHHHGTNKEGA